MEKILTIDDKLKLLRGEKGDNLKVKVGGLEVPVRILTHSEKRNLIESAKINLKVLKEEFRDIQEAEEVMKAILVAAATVNGTPNLPRAFLDQTSDSELSAFFDQYETLEKQMIPEFQTMTAEDVAKHVDEIKKKAKEPKELYTWQLAGIGRFFLENLI